MKDIPLVGWIFICLFLGIGTGTIVLYSGESLLWVLDIARFASEIFLRLLRMIIVPLIVTSIITGVCGVGRPENLGRLGLKTLVYYLTTSLFAILVGLLMVNLFQPGVGADLNLLEDVKMDESQQTSLINIFIRMIPVNFLYAATQGKMLSVIFFSVLFGYFMTKTKEQYKTTLEAVIKAGFEVMMKMTQGILLLAPIGIWGLMTKLIATTGFKAFIPLGWYTLCVSLALFIHAAITLPCFLFFITKANPLEFLRHMRFALITAFSTASSSATLPITIQNIEDNAKVPNHVSSFVLPLGATINMDGTALYECVAAVFIAQAYGLDLTLANQATIVVTALLASIGAAGIPMAGLVMMSVILNAIGLPLEGVGLIIAVDRILDMLRTTVNVWSDSCGAYLIAKTEDKIVSQ
jgi:proton glutamate symport protein